MSIRAALYLRQSQALGDDEAAVRRQEAACRSLAETRDLDIVSVYRDNDVSATSAKVRPAYARMIADYSAGNFSAVVAWDLDRLYRKPRELEDLIDLAEKAGLGLYTASGDADLSTDGGRLFARIKAAVAKGEVERKSARQRLRFQQDRDQGRPYWRRRPFGYELDGTHREVEARAIREAYASIAAGESINTIVRRWNAAGLRTPTTKSGEAGGKLMSGPVVRKILERPGTAGFLDVDGELVKGSWEPIVDEQTWRRYVAARRRTGRSGATPGRPTQLLSGLAWCGVCEPGASRVWANRATRGHMTYRCSAQGHLVRKADICDAFVSGWVVARLARADAVELIVSQDDEVDLDALRAERESIRTRMDQLADDHYVLGVLPREVFLETQKALQLRLAELEGQMVADDVEPALRDLVECDDVRNRWDELSLERRRRVVSSLLDVVIPPGRGTPLQLHPREGR